MRDFENMGQLAQLPTRKERAFPSVIQERHWRYSTASKTASQLLNRIAAQAALFVYTAPLSD
ncbi:hypothetical protein SAMN05216516_101578 [Izhakiella capsodis]|uniref:Uncharacterized protein n=1 Tax=Izhakiella capsodis TaxID=1367852 RepID=A0A1I4V6E7_9GAMM|nr:hypothetical protein SAMN05216516_101578 [Izhakiella capsodis]